MKKCAVCPTEFEPYNSMIRHCSPECGYKLHKIKKNKKIRKETLQYRKDNKKVSEWIKEAQAAINLYVRLRDHSKPCVSCLKPANTKANDSDASHYRSRGAAPHLRFNLHNIHKSCKYCNNYLSGNIVEYRKEILIRIGPEKLLALEYNNGYKKFTKEYCERIKKVFSKKSRMKKKRLGI